MRHDLLCGWAALLRQPLLSGRRQLLRQWLLSAWWHLLRQRGLLSAGGGLLWWPLLRRWLALLWHRPQQPALLSVRLHVLPGGWLLSPRRHLLR